MTSDEVWLHPRNSDVYTERTLGDDQLVCALCVWERTTDRELGCLVMLAFMGVFLKRDNEIKQTKELDFFVDELIISN